MPAQAWGEKGHYLVAEAATLALPTDMPHFFYEAFPQLIWGAYDPDRWKATGPSLDSVNPPDHFLDYEYVAHLKLPPERYRYIALLFSSDTIRRQGITVDEPGFLPWRIAELSDRLTTSWRQWRSSRPGSSERAFIEAHIIRDAAVLGHYVGDAANPHHTTVHFNGWVAANPHGYANDCEIHSRFESQFVAQYVALEDVLPHVDQVADESNQDYFNSAMSQILSANRLVEDLYRIDRSGGFAPLQKPVSQEAMAFASARLGAGASNLRDLWWSTWRNSAKARPRRTSDD